MREYTFKFPCESLEEAEFLRERTHDKLWSDLSTEEVVKELRTSVMFDTMRFECVVKVEVF